PRLGGRESGGGARRLHRPRHVRQRLHRPRGRQGRDQDRRAPGAKALSLVRVWVKLNAVSRSSPRKRGSRVSSAIDWIPGMSAFTRVFDALCAGMSGGSVLDNRDHGVRRWDMRCLTPDLIPEALTPMSDNLMPEP